jgi:hypothetical protein
MWLFFITMYVNNLLVLRCAHDIIGFLYSLY